MRVLISRLSAMGDVVCTLPVASAFKRSFPECHVTWAVQHNFAPIVERCASVDEVIPIRGRRKSLLEDLKKIGDLEPFDIAIDAQGLTKSALVVFMAKAKRKLGYHWQREISPIFSQKVRPDSSSIHVVDQYVDVARAAGCTAHRADFALKPTEGDNEAIKDLKPQGRYAVVHPGGGWATKRWPVTNFAQVCHFLTEKQITPVLIGIQPEAESAERIQQLVPAAKNLVNRTNLGALIALIDNASVHIGGDTGSSHIAAALNTPAVGIYLVTRPARSCPYGQFDNCPEPTTEGIIQMVERLT